MNMSKHAMVLAVAALAAACESYPGYEASVRAHDPIYCYKSVASLSGLDCYTTPYHRDGRQLVNYYGPAPYRYAPPPSPPPARLAPPKPIGYWVKDPEPVPRANPPGN